MKWKGLIEDYLFVGDIHGRSKQLAKLWTSVQELIPNERFRRLRVVFLGDYIDRGDDSKAVIEFLCRLPERYKDQQHTFLCGNHEFAMKAFLNIPPFASTDFGFTSSLFKPKVNQEDEIERWYSGSAYNSMHIQGRRWATHGLYDSESTFKSYGVAFSDREGLFNALPSTHRSFFSKLHWVYENSTAIGNIIAVHAGLEYGSKRRVLSQLVDLRDRHVGIDPFVEPLHGRENVIGYPPSLREPYLQTRSGLQEPRPRFLISGHHGFTSLNEYRIVVDSSTDEDKVSAVLLSNAKVKKTAAYEDESLLLAGHQDQFVSRKQKPPPKLNQPRNKPVHMYLF